MACVMCHRNTWWFKWFKSGKFQASISASPPPKTWNISFWFILCPCVGLLVLLTNFSCKLWCKSNIQTKWRCVGFLWFFSWCLVDLLEIWISFPTFPTSTCLCLRLLCLLPRRQGILQVLPRDFTGFHRWNIPKKSCQQCWKAKRIRISMSHKPFQCHTVIAPCMSCPCSKSFIPFCAQLTPMTQQKWAAHLYAYDFGSFFLGHLVRRLPRLLSDTLEYHEYRVHQNIQK